MKQGINHHSVIESFRQIGEKEGFIPIKEYSLLNLDNELTDERVDLVWINKNNKIDYVFEFDSNSNGFKNSMLRVEKIKGVKKYLFIIKNTLINDCIKLRKFQDSQENLLNIINLLKQHKINLELNFYDKNLELKDK